VQASINIEDVRRAYYDAIDGDPEAWSYWIRAIYIDPNELIVDIGEGDSNLLRIPFDVNADGEVEFGETSPTRVEYVAAAGQAAAATGRRVTVYASRDDARPDNEEANAMTPEELRQMRAAFGMAEDATEDQVREELAKRAEAQPDEGGDGEGGDPADPAVPGNGVTVDPATLEQLKRDAKAGVAARTEQLNERREAYLSGVVKAGKIPPSRKDHYRELHKRDPKGTEEFLDGLESGVLPVNEEEVGEAGALEAQSSAYPSELFPEVAQLRARAASGEVPFVTKD
jgi:hypothetical protein